MATKTKDMTDIAKEKFINPYTDFGFKKLFKQAEIAKYDDIERRQYEASLKEYWDYTSTMDTAHDKCVAEGIRKEKTETIHRLHEMGLSFEQIARGAGMSIDDVKRMLE